MNDTSSVPGSSGALVSRLLDGISEHETVSVSQTKTMTMVERGLVAKGRGGQGRGKGERLFVPLRKDSFCIYPN